MGDILVLFLKILGVPVGMIEYSSGESEGLCETPASISRSRDIWTSILTLLLFKNDSIMWSNAGRMLNFSSFDMSHVCTTLSKAL